MPTISVQFTVACYMHFGIAIQFATAFEAFEAWLCQHKVCFGWLSAIEQLVRATKA